MMNKKVWQEKRRDKRYFLQPSETLFLKYHYKPLNEEHIMRLRDLIVKSFITFKEQDMRKFQGGTAPSEHPAPDYEPPPSE